jgi:ribosomal protein S27E
VIYEKECQSCGELVVMDVDASLEWLADFLEYVTCPDCEAEGDEK